MKQIFTIIVTLISFWSFGQTDSLEFANLVRLGDIYSKNVNATGPSFNKSVAELRSPGLNHIIDALIAIGEIDKRLLTKEFLNKPSETELRYWYVIREIHYNKKSKDTIVKSSETIATEVLAMDIDSRWLLSNYYYRITRGVAKLFNKKNLKKYNFNLDEYGLEDETEKAILFFSLSNSLIQRFKVLQVMNNYEKLLEFANKLPTFNGKAYYEYTSFNFSDFDWIGHEKTESYLERHLGNLYGSLIGHFSALAEKKKTNEMRLLYFNSVLFIPDYYKYAGGLENDLKALYKKSKK